MTDNTVHRNSSLNRSALRATTHCLTGCALGEVLGMVVATAFGWGNTSSIAVSIVLAFFFGYALTLEPVVRANVPLRRAVGLTLASDTLSITTMETVDNAFILVVAGAIAAGLGDALFWTSLGVSLVIAFAAAFPVNRVGSSRADAAMPSSTNRTQTSRGNPWSSVPAVVRIG